MDTTKCPVCNLPWLTQKGPLNATGSLSNSGEDHLGHDAHYIFCFADRHGSRRTIAIRMDDVAGLTDHLQILAGFRVGGNPNEELPEGHKRILSTSITVLLRRLGDGEEIQIHNVATS